MAEYVHQTLEEMIPELEEMSRIGIFTVKETKVILKKREAHEYKLRQLTKTKESYLNYIKYETGLLELVKVRRKKYGQEGLKKGIEKSISNRIHQLYRLLTTRFQECVQFWEMHIAFSKQMKEKAFVTRLYERSLKIHSRNEDLWVKAAQWESDIAGNGNPEQARTILLKGQRTNPDSEDIFLQILQLELQIGKKIAKRKHILHGETENDEQSQELESEFKLAEIVYRNGLELFPDRPDMHLKMLHLVCRVKEASKFQEKIVRDLQRMYPDTPQVWSAVALKHISNITNLNKAQTDEAIAQCVRCYEETLQNVKSGEMWETAITGMLNVLSLQQVSESSWLLQKILTMFEKGLQVGTISEDLGTRLMGLLVDLNLCDDLAKVTSRLIDLHPQSTHLWLAHMRSEAQQGRGELVDVMEQALKVVPSEKAWPLWEFSLNALAAFKSDALEGLMEKACRDICPQVCLPAKEWSLHYTYHQGGLKKARNIYNSLRLMRPISLKFFQIYVSIEASQIEPDLKRIRAAFEEGVASFGATHPDLWLNYIQMEREIGGLSSQAGLVHQRASNALKSHLRESFIRKHALMC